MGDFVSYGMTNEKLNKGEKIMSQNKKRVNNPSSKMTDESINIVLSFLIAFSKYYASLILILF